MVKYWKILMFFPIIALAVATIFLLNNLYTTGEIIERDIELTGGKLITVQVSGLPDATYLESKIPNTDIRLTTGMQNILLIQTIIDANETSILETLASENVHVIGEPSIRTIGPALSEVFWEQAQIAIIAAFLLMAFVVFILFRTVVPSLTVILAALTDIVVTVMIMGTLEIKLSLATFAGLMMLIGYSVDTDILLTTRLMKTTKGEVPERVKSATITGLTMTTTTIIALVVMHLLIENVVIQEIAIVLIIGLVVDIFTTWLTNVGILRMYTERRESAAKGE